MLFCGGEAAPSGAAGPPPSDCRAVLSSERRARRPFLGRPTRAPRDALRAARTRGGSPHLSRTGPVPLLCGARGRQCAAAGACPKHPASLASPRPSLSRHAASTPPAAAVTTRRLVVANPPPPASAAAGGPPALMAGTQPRLCTFSFQAPRATGAAACCLCAWAFLPIQCGADRRALGGGAAGGRRRRCGRRPNPLRTPLPPLPPPPSPTIFYSPTGAAPRWPAPFKPHAPRNWQLQVWLPSLPWAAWAARSPPAPPPPAPPRRGPALA